MAIALAVVGEWFVEVAKDKGWYSNAGPSWDSLMSAVLSFVATPIFYVPFLTGAGLVAGLWVDAGLRYIESYWRRMPEIDWIYLDEEISRTNFLLGYDIDRQKTVAEGYSPISQETVSNFYALLFYIHRRGLAPQRGIPSPKIAEDPDLFFEVATRYLAAIQPFVRSRDRDSIKDFGGATIDMVYKWHNEGTGRSQSDIGDAKGG